MLIRDSRGMTLIEWLVTIAIGALILVLLSVALLGARKESRDVKRLSDMQQMRSSMAAIKVQFGSYLDAGCPIGAVRQCQGTNLERVLPTLKNFVDPSGTTLCTDDCTKACQYSFTDQRNDNQYTVLFYLEKGIDQFNRPGCYALTEGGIQFVK
jgi:prepilin-type N-terminal cleavage/methylation domain-containing protein